MLTDSRQAPPINVGTLREMLAQPEVLWRQMAAMSASELCVIQVSVGGIGAAAEPRALSLPLSMKVLANPSQPVFPHSTRSSTCSALHSCAPQMTPRASAAFLKSILEKETIADVQECAA